MQVLITCLERSCVIDIDPSCSLEVLELTVAQEFGLPACCGAFSLASSSCVIDVCSSEDDESSSSVGSILCCAGRQDGVRELFIKHRFMAVLTSSIARDRRLDLEVCCRSRKRPSNARRD
jgi:hypothetical protein